MTIKCKVCGGSFSPEEENGICPFCGEKYESTTDIVESNDDVTLNADIPDDDNDMRLVLNDYHEHKRTKLITGLLCDRDKLRDYIANPEAKEAVDDINSMLDAYYNEAVTLMYNDDEERAIEMFKWLGTYNNADKMIPVAMDKIKERIYKDAEQLLAEGKHDKAKKIFMRLGSYSDAEYRVADCDRVALQERYDEAERLFKAEDYKGASKIFAELGSFSDAENRVKECDEHKEEYALRQARELMNRCDYTTALTYLTGLESSEAYVMMDECANNMKKCKKSSGYAYDTLDPANTKKITRARHIWILYVVIALVVTLSSLIPVFITVHNNIQDQQIITFENNKVIYGKKKGRDYCFIKEIPTDVTKLVIEKQINGYSLHPFDGDDPVDVSRIKELHYDACVPLEGEFANSTALEKVHLGKNAKGISSGAFANCKNLTYLEIDPNVDYLSSEAFTGCDNIRHIKSNFKNIRYIDISHVETFECVNELYDNCFKGEQFTALKTLILGVDYKYVALEQFYNCPELESVVMEGVESIGDNAFSGCPKLKSVTLTNENMHIISVANYVFSGCGALQKVDFGNNKCRSIGTRIFAGCASLEEADLGYVAVIPESTFAESPLLKSFDFSSVITIGESAFKGCTALKDIDLKSVTNVQRYAFMGCTGITTVEMSKVKTLGSGAFANCSSLTKVTVRDLADMYNEVFMNCTSLSEIAGLGNTNLKYVDSKAFMNCASLREIVLPDSVKEIESNAFRKCPTDMVIYCNTNNPSLMNDKSNWRPSYDTVIKDNDLILGANK